jgi:hypothetical protein
MSTTDLATILEPLRAEAERKIKEEISGPQNMGRRFLYDTVMPIHLNVTGGSQEYNLEFLAGGSVQLHTGLAPNPDVSVQGDLATLTNVILKRSRHLFDEAERSGRIIATSHSWKGQQAMKRVKDLLSAHS